LRSVIVIAVSPVASAGALRSAWLRAPTSIPTNQGDRQITPRLLHLIASAELPGAPPADTADRMICATARERALAVVMRDQRILSYGTAEFVNVVAC